MLRAWRLLHGRDVLYSARWRRFVLGRRGVHLHEMLPPESTAANASAARAPPVRQKRAWERSLSL